MPLARIDLTEGKSAEYRRTIADIVYDQMIVTLGTPADRFQVVTQHPPGEVIMDTDYLGLSRSEDCIFIQLVFLNVATPEQKGAFYRAVVKELHERLLVRTEDVFFNLITVQPSDWSMGDGIVTYGKGVPADRLDPNSVPAGFTWNFPPLET